MKNWMIELENRTDPEIAKFTISLVACSVMAATIIAGNWHLFF